MIYRSIYSLLLIKQMFHMFFRNTYIISTMYHIFIL